MRNRALAIAALVLGLLEVCLVLTSWVLSVLLPDSGVRSLLGSEGVRWFFGSFADIIGGRPLAWLLLMSMAIGCAHDSGITRLLRPARRLHYRQRIARSFAVAMLMAYVVMIAALTLPPHAVLLSATGRLFPSPFSASLVPVTCFGVCLLSVVCGIVSGRYRSVTDVYHSLFKGIGTLAPLFLHYILLIQLYYSAVFMLG